MRYVSSILLIGLVILTSACSKVPTARPTNANTDVVEDIPAEWVVINNYSGSGAE